MADETFRKLQIQLAEDLKAARLAAGLSQESLALQAEVDRTYVSQLERGVANPSLLILQRLADALDAPLTLTIGLTHKPAVGGFREGNPKG